MLISYTIEMVCYSGIRELKDVVCKACNITEEKIFFISIEHVNERYELILTLDADLSEKDEENLYKSLF